MKKLHVVGAGRVGTTLCRLWHAQRVFEVGQVINQTPQSTLEAIRLIGAGKSAGTVADLRAADIWMLSVPDAVLASIAQNLADRPPMREPGIVFHCSGAYSSALLAPLRALGWSTASVHCILSFASVPAAVQQFPGTACALEGDVEALAVLRPAMQAIGANCFDIAAADKVLYHAAAVFATNFIPVLQSVAEAAWRSSGVPQPVVEQLRATLLRNAAENITRLGPEGALTGPAARGDVDAIARQSAVVRAWNGEAADAYEALSALALRMAKTAREAQATRASGT
jgi:predicted short-subunit dehydrogenase-like oxidoreductase (DUF2520 family)